MRQLYSTLAAVALCLGTAFVAPAAAENPGISDQRYIGGKYTGTRGAYANPLANCPWDQRGMYRGTLYCRKPAYQVHAPRHPSCPDGFKGKYRGNIYCVEPS